MGGLDALTWQGKDERNGFEKERPFLLEEGARASIQFLDMLSSAYNVFTYRHTLRLGQARMS